MIEKLLALLRDKQVRFQIDSDDNGKPVIKGYIDLKELVQELKLLKK